VRLVRLVRSFSLVNQPKSTQKYRKVRKKSVVLLMTSLVPSRSLPPYNHVYPCWATEVHTQQLVPTGKCSSCYPCIRVFPIVPWIAWRCNRTVRARSWPQSEVRYRTRHLRNGRTHAAPQLPWRSRVAHIDGYCENGRRHPIPMPPCLEVRL
jgi:hypothetical protein